MQFNRVKKTARKTELNVLWHSTGFPSGLSDFFFVSSVCLLVHVAMVDKYKSVVCGHIGHNVIRKEGSGI